MRQRQGYEPLQNEERDPRQKADSHDARFDIPPTPIPWASIGLATFLLLLGTSSFILAWFHFTQRVMGKVGAEFGLTFVSLITFIPGFYHTRMAYYAWKGYRGYSFDKIPSYQQVKPVLGDAEHSSSKGQTLRFVFHCQCTAALLSEHFVMLFSFLLVKCLAIDGSNDHQQLSVQSKHRSCSKVIEQTYSVSHKFCYTNIQLK